MLSGLKILVVDDDPDILEVLLEDFKDNGFLVQIAHSVSKAKDILSQQEIDIVLSDNYLSDGSGEELLSLTQDRGPKTTFYFMTGDLDLAEKELQGKGAQGVFIKPFLVEGILGTLIEDLSNGKAKDQD